MNSLHKITSTSILLQAIRLLGASYKEKDEFEYLTMPDSRAYQIVDKDDSWVFRPLWTEATSLVVLRPVDAWDLKDKIYAHLVAIRGPVKNNSNSSCTSSRIE